MDIDLGLKLCIQAAQWNHPQAQKQLLKFFAAEASFASSHRATFVECARKCILEKDKSALRALQSVNPDVASTFQSKWNSERLIRLFASVDGLECRPSRIHEVKSLHLAAVKGSLAELMRLLQAGAPVNETNCWGQTPLIAACQSSNFEVALYLLQLGSDLTVRDNDGFTALHWLICFSDDEKRAIAAVVKAQAIDPDVEGTFPFDSCPVPEILQGGPAVTGTPLVWATACGDIVAIEVLLDLGASTTGPCSVFNAFQYACMRFDSDSLLQLARDSTVASKAADYLCVSDRIKFNVLWLALSCRSRFSLLMLHGLSFSSKIDESLRLMFKYNVSCEAVMIVGNERQSAPFAVASRRCCPDIMKAGIASGFAPHVNRTFGREASGGPPIILAIADGDRETFQYLIQAGASLTWKGERNQSLLTKAAHGTDDTWFVERLLEENKELGGEESLSRAFQRAVRAGNLKNAGLLWEKGAKRESITEPMIYTCLGQLLNYRSRNATRSIAFLLELPDRGEPEGFIVAYPTDVSFRELSAFHWACTPYAFASLFAEDASIAETSHQTFSLLLLRKFNEERHLNSTAGPQMGTALSMAVELGNHHIVRLLLEAGADPNIWDENSATPLDKLSLRYLRPEKLEVIRQVRHQDKRLLKQRLDIVNANTGKILRIFKRYSSRFESAAWPQWCSDPESFRSVDWVLQMLDIDEKMDRLRESRPPPNVEQALGQLQQALDAMAVRTVE